jgi:pyruvate/2-oxoglutarate dehydrogenase complex dihydrolipoamide acyltransferase (E2) component
LSRIVEQRVPDLGDFRDVEVIEVLVKAGDRVERESPLITLETDKATMDVPATEAGVVREVKLKKGDRVSKDSLIAIVAAGEGDTVRIPSLSETVVLERAPKAAAAPAPATPPAEGRRHPGRNPRPIQRRSSS